MEVLSNNKLGNINGILVVVFILGLLITNFSVVYAEDRITLIYDMENYEYQKMEEEKGVLVGAYVLQDSFIEQSMEQFNDITNEKHGSFFRYVGYGMPFPTKWVEEVKAVGAIPHIAFEPNGGLEEVVDDIYIREWARAAFESDTPIYLRWASEMNGTWTQYSGKSEQYIEKWRMMYDLFQEEAPNCAFVWTVFTFPESTINSFYPGDEYVDWVGVNIYNVMYHNNNINSPGDHEDPLELLDYVYNLYSYKKPIQVSEYGATHYSITDGEYHSEWAAEKITRLYSNLAKYYPRVKSIFYFDVNNLTHYNESRRINDYSVTNDEIVLEAYKDAVSSYHFLSEYTENKVMNGKERLTYSGFSKKINGNLYVPVEYFENYLGLKIAKLPDDSYEVSKENLSVIVKSEKYKQVTNFKMVRKFNMLPLREVTSALGYNLHIDRDPNSILIVK